jgi:CspA family cold shock protein
VSNRERAFRPSRRRDFDDDDYQPLSRNFGYAPPTGPQFDTPSGPAISATVKWYNPGKGFGFVTLGDGSGDAFLHASVVQRAGHDSVPAGATLEIRSGPGPKGPQVTEIVSVDASTALLEEIGTVKWFNTMRGFGFIGSDRGGKDIFVHVSALERSGVTGLAEGQRVAVDVADGQKGPETVSLRLIQI